MPKASKNLTPHLSLSKPTETIGEWGTRVRKGGAHKPLRSKKELADEFGVSTYTLSGIMKSDPSSPRPRYSTGTSLTGRNTWFDPDEVRKWWKARSK
jgi:hypothetical protein